MISFIPDRQTCQYCNFEIGGCICPPPDERSMTGLSDAAKTLLKQAATAEYATLAVLRLAATPRVIAELIDLHAIRVLEGGRENEVRCQITKDGLELYRALGQGAKVRE